MARYLIDANLPYRFTCWQSEAFQHVFNLGDDMPDQAIWQYPRENDLVIVTKDSDFSDWVMLSEPPPPRVIRFRVGNMRLREFESFVLQIWPHAEALVQDHKLILVWRDRIEAVA